MNSFNVIGDLEAQTINGSGENYIYINGSLILRYSLTIRDVYNVSKDVSLANGNLMGGYLKGSDDITVTGTLNLYYGRLDCGGALNITETLTAPCAQVNVKGNIQVNGTVILNSARFICDGDLYVNGTFATDASEASF